MGLSDEIKAIYQRATENRVGSDQASGLLAVTGDPEPPLAPRGLPVMALSTSAIPGSWEPPASNRDITGYVLNLWPMGDRVWVGGQESLATSVPDGGTLGRFLPLLVIPRPVWALARPLGLWPPGVSSGPCAPCHRSSFLQPLPCVLWPSQAPEGASCPLCGGVRVGEEGAKPPSCSAPQSQPGAASLQPGAHGPLPARAGPVSTGRLHGRRHHGRW